MQRLSTAVPSGEQVEIARGAARAVITEVGATLREYEVDGRAVVDGFGADEMCPGAHGQVLAPWPNRIADGRYVAPDGEAMQLALTEPLRGNAIHGLVNWLPWRVARRSADAATMWCELHPRPGYPFALQLETRYALVDGGGLECTISATNIGDRPAPYGAGHHPYIACPPGGADSAHIQIPGQATLETDERGVPTGRLHSVDGTELDFRTPRPVGATVIDHCYTQLQPDADGTIRATLGDGASWRTTLWMRPPFRWLMVFTSDTLQPPLHRRAIAVEPMTCPPNAFQSGEDVVVLDPGESLSATWGITPA
jgi:aldose 1-epimerase